MMSEMEAKEMTEPETVNALDLIDGNLTNMIQEYKFPEGMSLENVVEAGKAIGNVYSLEKMLNSTRLDRMIEGVENNDKPDREKPYELPWYALDRAIKATGEPQGGLLHIIKDRRSVMNHDVGALMEAYEGAMFTCPKCGHRGARTYPTIYGRRHCKKCKAENSFSQWVREQFRGFNYKFRDYEAENAFLEWRDSFKFQIQVVEDDIPNVRSAEMQYKAAEKYLSDLVREYQDAMREDTKKNVAILVWRSDKSEPVCKVKFSSDNRFGDWSGNFTPERHFPEKVEYAAFKKGYAVPPL